MVTVDQHCYSVDLTPDDYRQFYMALGRHQGKPPTWIYPAAIGLSIPVAAVLAHVTDFRTFDIGVSCVLAFLCGMAAMIAVMRVAQIDAMRRLSAMATKDWGRLLVTLDDTGVAAYGDGIMMQVQWAALKDVTVEGEAVIVWSGRLQAIRIPPRAFADAAARDAAVAFIRRHMPPGAGPIAVDRAVG